MSYQTIAEIYDGNAKIRARLKQTIENLTDEQLNFRTDETTWTIREIVEHIAIVEGGIAKICAKLLHESGEENLPNDGNANISADFLAKTATSDRRTTKLSAPDRVKPSGARTIEESFAKMIENGEILNQLQAGLETINTQKAKFPHPYFGDMTATEWLLLVGGHERRHIDQIEEILEKV